MLLIAGVSAVPGAAAETNATGYSRETSHRGTHCTYILHNNDSMTENYT